MIFSSCLLPPSDNGPKYLSEEEFEELTDLTQSREFVKSGRLDEGELLLRKLIKKRVQKPIPYNDLGYLLYLESRLDEAELILKKSISLQPIFVAPRLTLARVYIANGNLLDSFSELDKVEEIIDNEKPSDYLRVNGEPVSPMLKSQISRLKASSYYLNGQFDEAVCYSNNARKLSGTITETSLHLRLLLSLEMIKDALSLIENYSTTSSTPLPPNLSFDQSLALFSISRLNPNYKTDADLSINRVVELTGLDQEEISAARLLRYDMKRDSEEFELIKESLLDEVSNPCKIKRFDTKGYWPKSVLEAVKRSYLEVCKANES